MVAVVTMSATLDTTMSVIESRPDLLAELKTAIWRTLDTSVVKSPEQVLVNVAQGSVVVTFTIVAPPWSQAHVRETLLSEFGGDQGRASMAAALATVPELDGVNIERIRTVQSASVWTPQSPIPMPPTSARPPPPAVDPSTTDDSANTSGWITSASESASTSQRNPVDGISVWVGVGAAVGVAAGVAAAMLAWRRCRQPRTRSIVRTMRIASMKEAGEGVPEFSVVAASQTSASSTRGEPSMGHLEEIELQGQKVL